MEQNSNSLRESTLDFFKKMGIEDPDLSYVTDESFSDLTNAVPGVSDLRDIVFNAYDIIHEPGGRITFGYQCGTPARAFCYPDQVVSMNPTTNTCHGQTIYTLIVRV